MGEEIESPLRGFAPVAGKTPARQAKERLEKQRKAVVPRTKHSGESAGDIIGAWVEWNREKTGVAVPPRITARVGKVAKGLIIAGYEANAIKYALVVWTFLQAENAALSPDRLEAIAWKYAREKGPKADAWRAEWRARVQAINASGAGGVRTGWTGRQERSLETLNNWGREG